MSNALAPGDLPAGTLFVVGTPIGNLGDITYRAVRVLEQVDLVAAEDTRHARVLLSHFGIDKPMVSLFEANERGRIPRILARLTAGETVALITEAGMPGISDPGHLLMLACREHQLAVDVIPGPSAVTTALLLSGFPPARFRFLGFLPRKGPARRQLLRELADSRDPTVLFESPHRLSATLDELAPILGQRQLAVVREMTKLHQEVIRGDAQQIHDIVRERRVLGEVTLVVDGGDDPGIIATESALRDEVRRRLTLGHSARDIARALAGHGGSRGEIYRMAITLASGDEPPPDSEI